MDNRIREIRQAKGMTLDQLAEACNTQKGQISNLEVGQRRLSLDWMRRLAPALECAPADLLVDEDVGFRLNEDEEAMITALRAAQDRKPDALRAMAAMLAALAGPAETEQSAA